MRSSSERFLRNSLPRTTRWPRRPSRRQSEGGYPGRYSKLDEQSRFLARAVEFACFGLVALAVGLTAFGTVEQALARPLTQARAALDR